MQLEVFKVLCEAAACQSGREKGEKATAENFTFWSRLSVAAEKGNAHGLSDILQADPQNCTFYHAQYIICNLQLVELAGQGFTE